MTATSDRLQRANLLPAHLDIMLALGRMEDARRACAELRTLAERLDTDVLRAMAAQAQGAIALAEGDARRPPVRCAPRSSVGTARSAVRSRARARADRSRVPGPRRRRGQRLEFDAARLAFERLGARPDLARLAALAAPADARGPEHPLTARERDVLRLIALGHTNKAIAAALGLSERTIDRHVSNILGKLDVPSRAAATARAYNRKLL